MQAGSRIFSPNRGSTMSTMNWVTALAYSTHWHCRPIADRQDLFIDVVEQMAVVDLLVRSDSMVLITWRSRVPDHVVVRILEDGADHLAMVNTWWRRPVS